MATMRYVRFMSDSGASPARPSIFDDPEGYLEDFQRRTGAMREKADELQQAMSEGRATVRSEEGEVELTVNVSGGLEDIRFDREVRRLGAETLRELVLDTYRAATEQASRNLDAVMENVLGADSETMSVYRNAREQHGGNLHE